MTDITDPRARHNLEARANYNLLAAIIECAVKDFNKGKVAQKQDAAAFFRDSENTWMFSAVNATVHDVVKNRLNGDPFDLSKF